MIQRKSVSSSYMQTRSICFCLAVITGIYGLYLMIVSRTRRFSSDVAYIPATEVGTVVSANVVSKTDIMIGVYPADVHPSALPQLSSEEFTIASTVLKPLEYPIQTYLQLIHSSVQMVNVPLSATPSLGQAIRDCRNYPRSSFIDNQHSLEVRFPLALQHMHIIAQEESKPEYSLLWQNDTLTEPLFYLLRSYQYYVVHCSYNRRGKESWDKGINYLNELSSFVVQHSAPFQRNLGVDFLVPASHPKSGPFGVKTHIISAYQRQTFLRTDLDFNGNTPRDIIVPYYVPRNTLYNDSIAVSNPNLRRTPTTTSGQHNTEGKLLLYFAGGKNPPGGLREQLESQFHSLQTTEGLASRDVLFTTQRVSHSSYERDLHRSVFCAHVRGDTASSSRLFQIIEAGCIPVVIADWLPLPFESLIDFSKFMVRFPESIVHDVRQLVSHLRSIPDHRVQEMRAFLAAVRNLLVFPSLQAGEYSRLNPVSLTLVEMFIRRKQYCDELHGSTRNGNGSSMCTKLYERLQSVVK